MSDKEFLQWIYDRMVHQYNENPLYDYMHKLKAIVDNMSAVKENCNLDIVSNNEERVEDCPYCGSRAHINKQLYLVCSNRKCKIGQTDC